MRRLALFLLLAALLAVSCTPLREPLIQAAAPRGKMLIVIDTRQMSLTLYENQKAIKRYPVAAGTAGTPSPLGVFQINRRFTTEGNGFGTRFLGLNVPWGMYGIHGTNAPGSIGSHASHGCIRMFTKDAEELYRLVGNGTYVIIEEGSYGELGASLRTLRPDDRNAHVRAVQRKLRSLGYYQGNPDGVYGPATAAALRRFRKDRGLSPQDVVDAALYKALGLILFE